jgi:hypothetical protein
VKVFLSHSFRAEDRHLVATIDSLLGAQDVLVATGRRLGGAAITPEILRRIETTDALVALLTRRERIGEEEAGRWTTHNWVRDEINYARGRAKPAIALVEAGVELDGAYDEHERITFDRDNPLDALLELAETIHVWREGLGVQRQVQIKPDDIGEELRNRENELTCKYRLVSPDGVPGDWRTTKPMLQPGGTILFVDGVLGDDHYIEVEVAGPDGRAQWWSPATAQLINVELRERRA